MSILTHLQELQRCVRQDEDTRGVWSSVFEQIDMKTTLTDEEHQLLNTIFKNISGRQERVREFMVQLKRSTLQHPRITKHFLRQIFPVETFRRSVHKFSHLQYIGPVLDYLRFLIFHVPTKKFQQQLSQYIKDHVRQQSTGTHPSPMTHHNIIPQRHSGNNNNNIISISTRPTGRGAVALSSPTTSATRSRRRHRHQPVSQYGQALQNWKLFRFHDVLTDEQCKIIHNELENGTTKRGHWMWYAFPADISDIFKNISHKPSKTSVYYSIKPAGVKAFLKDNHLKTYYKKALDILVGRLDRNDGFDLKKFFGDIDYNKFKFHIQLFYNVCQKMDCEAMGALSRIHNHIYPPSSTTRSRRLTSGQIRTV